MGQFPVQQIDSLSRGHTEPCRNQIHGGLRQNVNVGDDSNRSLSGKRLLFSIDDQLGTCRYKAIRGGRGQNCGAFHLTGEAEIFAHVNDRPASDGQHKVRVPGEMEKQ